MTTKVRRQFSPEHLSIARNFIVASTASMDICSSRGESQATLDFFSSALFRLVRTADEIAQSTPDPDIPSELRWVPVAKQMVRTCTRDMPAQHGREQVLLFDEGQSALQAEVYRDAYKAANTPSEV